MADKIDTRTKRQKNSKKARSQPVRKDFKTIMSEINPRTREELEKKRSKKELPEKGSKEFFMRGIRKLGKDVKETANVLETFTPIGPAKKAIQKATPLIKQKLALKGGGRAYGKNS